MCHLLSKNKVIVAMFVLQSHSCPRARSASPSPMHSPSHPHSESKVSLLAGLTLTPPPLFSLPPSPCHHPLPHSKVQAQDGVFQFLYRLPLLVDSLTHRDSDIRYVIPSILPLLTVSDGPCVSCACPSLTGTMPMPHRTS